MNLTNVTAITKQAIAQVLGDEYMSANGYLEGIPAEKLIDVGKSITEADFTVEKFTKALISLVYKLEVNTVDFKPLYSDIMVDRVDWGGFKEVGFVDYAEVMDDPVFGLVDGTDYSAIEHRFYQPKVSLKIYDEGKGICVPQSIQRETLTEAFKSYDAMNTYLSKIKHVLEVTVKKALDRYASVLVEGAIAVAHKKNGNQIYLITEAINAGVDGVTTGADPETLLQNPEYLKFCAMKIKELRDNMLIDTTAYNNGNHPIGGESKMYLNSKMDRALRFNTYADTYHEQYLAMGDYKSIPLWQAVTTSTGEPFEYDAVTTISLSADSSQKLGIGTSAVTIEDVIGFVYHPKALGICMFKEYATNTYTACADFWTEFFHVLLNQLLNDDFPMVAILNAEAPTT